MRLLSMALHCADARARHLVSAATASVVFLTACGGESAAPFYPDQGAQEWGPPVRLQVGAVPLVPPKVVLDAAGTATLLWDSYTGTGAVFLPRVSRSVSGSVWSTPVAIETAPATLQSFTVDLLDAGASPVSVWINQDEFSDPNIRSSTFAGSWTVPVTLPAQRLSGETAFAGNPSGAIVGIWTEQTAVDGERVVGARRLANGSWSTRAVVDPDATLADQLRVWPALALDAQGDAMAVWVRAPIGSVQGGPGRIYASRLSYGASVWTAPMQIDAAPGASARPQVAALGDGRFVAVWEQKINGRTSIYGAFFSGAAWQPTPTLLEDDDRGDAGLVRLAAGGSGAVQAVWMQSDGSAWTVWSARYSGTAWQSPGKPIAIATPGVERGDARVAMDARGNAIAVWNMRSLNGGPGTIEMSYLSAGGAQWTEPVALSANEVAPGGGPTLAMNSDGAAVVGWTAQVGADVSIIARMLRHP